MDWLLKRWNKSLEMRAFSKASRLLKVESCFKSLKVLKRENHSSSLHVAIATAISILFTSSAWLQETSRNTCQEELRKGKTTIPSSQ